MGTSSSAVGTAREEPLPARCCGCGCGAARGRGAAPRSWAAVLRGWKRGRRWVAAHECLLPPAANRSHVPLRQLSFWCWKFQSNQHFPFCPEQGRPGVFPDTKWTSGREGGRKLLRRFDALRLAVYFCWINFPCLYYCHAPPTQVYCAFPLHVLHRAVTPGSPERASSAAEFYTWHLCPARLRLQLVFATTWQKQHRIEKVLFEKKRSL